MTTKYIFTQAREHHPESQRGGLPYPKIFHFRRVAGKCQATPAQGQAVAAGLAHRRASVQLAQKGILCKGGCWARGKATPSCTTASQRKIKAKTWL